MKTCSHPCLDNIQHFLLYFDIIHISQGVICWEAIHVQMYI